MAKKKFYRPWLYFLERILAAVIFILPRGLALSLGRFLGRLLYRIVKRQREKILRNLRYAYGPDISDSKLRLIAPLVLENMAQTVIDVIQFPKLNLKKVKQFIDAGKVFEVYDSVLKEGKGVISMTAHLGNWELLAGVMGLNGFRGAVVAREIYYEAYNRWIVQLRKSLNVQTVYRKGGIRGILKVLRKNEIIGLLPDQDIDSLKGIYVPFFGKPAYTSIAPIKLSLVSGAPIVTNFLVREPGNRYRIILGEIIRPKVTVSEEEAIVEYTKAWMYQFEKIIRQHPEQWGWMHNRWKTQPSPVKDSDMMESQQEARDPRTSFAASRN